MALNDIIFVSRLGYPQFIPAPNTTVNAANAQDVTAGVMINFSFKYQWIINNSGQYQCNITEIKWVPCKFNNETLVTTGVTFQAVGFTQSKLTITFGTKSFTSKFLNNGDSGLTTSIDEVTSKYIPVSFVYSYVGTSTGATYSLKIENIKIPKPSRYENNIVFNKDGLNELIDNIKRYPVTNVGRNNKYGHIKVTHGNNPNNPVDVGIQGFRYSTTDNLFCGTDFLPYLGDGYNLGELYVPLDTPNDYRENKVYYKKEGNSYIPLGRLSQDEVTNIMTGAPGQPAITPLYTTHKWKNLYLSGDIGSSVKDGEIGNIYATNGNFSNEVTADTLTGDTLTGNLIGGSIKIGGTADNPAFYVKSNGDITMNGNITWGSTTPFKQIYHTGGTTHAQPGNLPSPTASIPPSGDSEWHTTYNQNDYWMSFTTNGGQTWQTPTRINAQDGKNGKNGVWDADNIIDALHDINEQGIFVFENPEAGSDETDKLIGISAEAILTSLLEANRITMNGGPNYNPTSSTSFEGGYISFRIPTPFKNINSQYTIANNLNKKGWCGRLGYLRGNGDGENPTAGLGFVIHTEASWTDVYGKNTAKVNDVDIGDKLHLILSSLILTNKGLALMTSENTGTPWKWLQRDSLGNSTHAANAHYRYKYLTGGQTSWVLAQDDYQEYTGYKFARLWIHEDNGGLYYSWVTDTNKTVNAWGWNGID